jgi:hypothetical protein
MAKDCDPDKPVGLDMEPEQAILDGAGTEDEDCETDDPEDGS